MRKRYFTVLIVLFLGLSIAIANEQAFGLEVKPGSYLTDTFIVLNEDSVPIMLNDPITKPTLLPFVYYHGPALCPKMMEGIADYINYSEALPGREYQIITLSIDHGTSF